MTSNRNSLDANVLEVCDLRNKTGCFLNTSWVWIDSWYNDVCSVPLNIKARNSRPLLRSFPKDNPTRRHHRRWMVTSADTTENLIKSVIRAAVDQAAIICIYSAIFVAERARSLSSMIRLCHIICYERYINQFLVLFVPLIQSNESLTEYLEFPLIKEFTWIGCE